MSIHQSATLLVTHGGLELVYPYTRIDCQGFALHVLQAGKNLVSVSPPLTTNTHGTGRPTGSKRFHSDFTPMFQLWYDRRAVNDTNRSGRPGTHAFIPTQPLVVLGAIYVPYLAALLFITISSTSLAAIPSNASSTCPKGLATPTSVFPGTNISTPSIPALFHQSGRALGFWGYVASSNVSVTY